MSGNTFGRLFRLTSFGESHGSAIGGIIDGCPAGLKVDFKSIQNQMDRRRPGQSAISTERNEADQLEWLSGFFDGTTTGTPIAFILRNKDQRSKDYSALKDVFRPSHADFSWQQKFGIRDYRGGGRSSARETTCRVAAGALAEQLLDALGITLSAYVQSVNTICMAAKYGDYKRAQIDSNIMRCPDSEIAARMIEAVEKARDSGDSLGGTISCVIKNCPAGLGEPVFDKLQSDIAKAMLSINAVKGFEYGSGFDGTQLRGSEHNDPFEEREGRIRTTKNHAGGILGGISTGEDITFRLAFKPVASIRKAQNTVDTSGKALRLEIEGRHDPCVLPRAVPIVEAMAALVIADHYLMNKTSKI